MNEFKKLHWWNISAFCKHFILGLYKLFWRNVSVVLDVFMWLVVRTFLYFWVPFLGLISKKDSSCYLLDNVLCHYSSQRSHRPILVIPLYWTKIENSHGILLSTFVRRCHWPRSKVSLLFKNTRYQRFGGIHKKSFAGRFRSHKQRLQEQKNVVGHWTC